MVINAEEFYEVALVPYFSTALTKYKFKSIMSPILCAGLTRSIIFINMKIDVVCVLLKYQGFVFKNLYITSLIKYPMQILCDWKN